MLIFGLSVKEALLTTLVFVCSTCGNNAAHRLVKRTRRLSIFFIPVLSVGSRFYDTCTACGRVIEVPRDQAENALRQGGRSLQ